MDGLLEKDVDIILGRVALRVQKWIVENAQVKTGRFKNSIVVDRDKDGNWIVGTNLDYAEYIEIGTEPHIIKPKKKKALAFNWGNAPISPNGKDGKFVYKEVHHPGTQGQNLFLQSATMADRFLKEELRRHKSQE